ncbi:MAG TPA: metallophosphoesterase [Syntrophomonadaceae bacterium]|nr:metallophosphoesterase [Syntrophomonadaceae bacterium]
MIDAKVRLMMMSFENGRSNKSRLYEHSLALLEKRLKQFNRKRFNIVFMADSWYGDGNASDNIFIASLEKAAQYNPLFIVHGGDIVFTGSTNRLINFVEAIEETIPEIPLFVVVGNHEEDGVDGPTLNYEEIIGPLHYKLDIPKMNFSLIALNNIRYRLDESELEFLKDSLAYSFGRTLVSMHIPPRAGKWAGSDHTFITGMHKFFKIIGDKVSRVLVSHIHAYATDIIKGNKFILSGGAGAELDKGQINHIVLFKFRGSEILHKRIAIGDPPFPPVTSGHTPAD